MHEAHHRSIDRDRCCRRSGRGQPVRLVDAADATRGNRGAERAGGCSPVGGDLARRVLPLRRLPIRVRTDADQGPSSRPVHKRVTARWGHPRRRG